MKVKLIKPHTHAGTLYDAGKEIEVNSAEAEWLSDRGVIQADVKAGNGGNAAQENKA